MRRVNIKVVLKEKASAVSALFSVIIMKYLKLDTLQESGLFNSALEAQGHKYHHQLSSREDSLTDCITVAGIHRREGSQFERDQTCSSATVIFQKQSGSLGINSIPPCGSTLNKVITSHQAPPYLQPSQLDKASNTIS